MDAQKLNCVPPYRCVCVLHDEMDALPGPTAKHILFIDILQRKVASHYENFNSWHPNADLRLNALLNTCAAKP